MPALPRFRPYPKVPRTPDPSAATVGGRWVALEKVHGANFVVAIAGDTVRFGKRKPTPLACPARAPSLRFAPPLSPRSFSGDPGGFAAGLLEPDARPGMAARRRG